MNIHRDQRYIPLNSTTTSSLHINNTHFYNTTTNLPPCDKGGGDCPYNRTLDANGAACYIIAVLLVYSISIVALIMSRIKRKHVKLLEDREIHKYLREFQIVKEKSTRDSYHDMKKAIMARLTNNRESKSNTNSQSNNPTSALSHNSSSASLTTMAMGRASVFPLLNVAMMQFQSSLLSGGLCGCSSSDNCPHIAGNVKFKRNQSWNVGEVLGSTSATSSSSSSSFFTSHVTKQVISGGVCGTPTLETVFESYDGENDTSFGFDLKKKNQEMQDDEGSGSSLPPQSENEVRELLESPENDVEWKKAETKVETKMKNNKFSFDFGGKQFGSNVDMVNEDQGALAIVDVTNNEVAAMVTGAGMTSSLGEVKVRETVTNKSCKKETLFEGDQKINWIEIDESKMTIRKKLTTAETCLSITGKRPSDAGNMITNDIIDNKFTNNNLKAICGSDDTSYHSKPNASHKIALNSYFQGPNPLDSVKKSSSPFLKISTASTSNKTDPQDIIRPNSNTHPSTTKVTFEAMKVNQSAQNKLTVTKVQPPTSLSGVCLTLENPLKITDSFESPAIEARSLNIFRHKMGIPQPESEARSNEAHVEYMKPPSLPARDIIREPEKFLHSPQREFCAKPIRPFLKQDELTNKIYEPTNKIYETPYNAKNFSKGALISNKHTSREFDDKPPLPKRNLSSTASKEIQETSKFLQRPSDMIKNTEGSDLDGFNMAKLEKLLLMRGNIKFADDNEDRKHDDTILETEEEKSGEGRVNFSKIENQYAVKKFIQNETKRDSDGLVNKFSNDARKSKRTASENNSKSSLNNSKLSSDYCSEDPNDYEDYPFGRHCRDPM